MRPPAITLVVATFVAAVTGCNTPRGSDGSLADGIVIGAVMLPSAVVAAPVLFLRYGGRIIGEGSKDRIYAKPGTSESDFENGICKAEGVEQRNLRPEIRHEADDTYRSIYRFDTRVYCGRFTQDEIAVKY